MTTHLNKIPEQDSLVTTVLKTLLDYLFSGEIQPGDRIPSERRLTEELGVNRPAIRQALRTLSFLGLLDIRQGSGTYFRDPDQDLLFTMFELNLTFGQRRLNELVEARSKVEVLVAGMAAERRTDAEVEELRTRLLRMRESVGQEFVDADIAFHGQIADSARNDVLRDMLKGVRTMVRRWIGGNVGMATSTETIYNDHAPIFEAIAAGDRALAEQAMANHMAGAISRLPADFFDSPPDQAN